MTHSKNKSKIIYSFAQYVQVLEYIEILELSYWILITDVNEFY